MIIPVRCFTCGKVLADKWEHFASRTNVRDLRPSPIEAIRTSEESAKIAATLDELGLTRMCCRRHFLGHVEIIDDLR